MGALAKFTLIKGRSSRFIAALLVFLVICIVSSQDTVNAIEENIAEGDNFSFSEYTIPNQIYTGDEFWFVTVLSYDSRMLKLDKQSLSNEVNLKPFDSMAAYSQEKTRGDITTYYRKYLLQAVEIFPGESYRIGLSNIAFISQGTSQRIIVNVPQHTVMIERRVAAEGADLAPLKGEIFNWRWFARIYTATFALILIISPIVVFIERKLRFRIRSRRAMMQSNPWQMQYWEIGKILHETRKALFEMELLAYDIANTDELTPTSLWDETFPDEEHSEWDSLWELVNKAYAKDIPEEIDATRAHQLLGVILKRRIKRGEEKNDRTAK